MDNSFLNYIRQPKETEHWKWAVENHVAPWVTRHNKSYWELVRWVSSERLNYIKPTMGREKFGNYLISTCPAAFERGDTQKSLKSNMDKFKYIEELSIFSRLEDDNEVRVLVKELESLFALQPDTPECTLHQPFTMQMRMEEWMEKFVDRQQYAQSFTRPTYCNFATSYSIEQYASKHFMNSREPSRIILFDCVDGDVDHTYVAQLAGIYYTDRRIKVFVASTNGFNNRTYAMAKQLFVGLIRIDPKFPIDDHCFVLPRFSDIVYPKKAYMEMLTGQRDMTVPIVVCDGSHINISLGMEMKYQRIAVKNLKCIKAPIMSYAQIENIAYELVKNDASYYEALLKQTDYRSKDIPTCAFDPYKLADEWKIKVERGNLHDKHLLANINIRNRCITLSNEVDAYSPCERFSLSHDFGHFFLHSYLGIDFIEGTTTTLTTDVRNQRWLEYQANVFAACLLMPAPVVNQLYGIYWRKEFQSDDVQPLTMEDEDKKPEKSFCRVVGPMSRKMNVSFEAMKIRLKKMDLIIVRPSTSL
jgi:Zn-dependent peptidase ImmA (M78 family)